MKALIEEAARLHLRVHAAYLTDDLLGFYVPSLNRIYFDIRLAPMERAEVIAHELGHAYYGHDCSTKANENQADRRAAVLLIDPDEYEQAENENDDPRYIAEALGVSENLVRIWRDCWLPLLLEKRLQHA